MNIDPDGNDGMVSTQSGDGSKKNPHIITITANYYYKKGDLNDKQVEALNKTISTYNNKESTTGKAKDGTYTVIKFNLSAQGLDTQKEVESANSKDTFTGADGGTYGYGNVVTTGSSDSPDKPLGQDVGGFNVQLISNNISEAVGKGFKESDILNSVFLHEIGHNLGGEHIDPDPMGAHVDLVTRPTNPNCHGECPTEPFVERKGLSGSFAATLVNRMDKPVGRPFLVRKKQ
jgi:hypothetical protein